MNPVQIELVQQSFARASRIGPHVAATFYAELFAIDPSLRALFQRDMIVQGQKLMSMLNEIVAGLHEPAASEPALRELAERHVRYGVEARHYASVGTALLRTLQHELGREFTPDTRAAWAAAYQLISDTMREAACGRAAERQP
jgi:hemoglobin-like flavoprotein